MAIGCGSDDPLAPNKKEETISSIAVSAEKSRVIGVDVILQLMAVAKNTLNSVIPNQDFIWSSADTGIATVNNQGQVTTTGLGSVGIQAQAQGLTGSITIEVLPEGVVSLSTSTTHDILPSGGVTQRLTFIAWDALGNPIPDPIVTWSSDNPEAATVNEEGIVTTGLHGRAILSLRSGEVVSELTLEVIATTGDGLTDLDLQLLPLFKDLNPSGVLRPPTGMSVALVKDGKLVMVRGYGLADPAISTPVEPTSLFRIASVSKPITAVTILRMVEEGQLQLDDKLLDLAPSLVPEAGLADDRARDITIRHLLEHRAGWDPTVEPNPLYFLRSIAEEMKVPSPPSHQALGQWLFGQSLHFDPGSVYFYNNLNYFMLGRVIEAVSGTSYETYVSQNVLGLIGITEMRIGGTLRSNRVINEVIYHYGGQNNSIFDEIAGQLPSHYGGGFHLSLMNSSGGWIASAVDLVRFGLAVDTPPTILGETLHNYMTSDQSGIGVYGAGWILDGTTYYHSGGLEGSNSILSIFEDGRVVALLFNGNINISFASFINPILAVNNWPDHDLFDKY